MTDLDLRTYEAREELEERRQERIEELVASELKEDGDYNPYSLELLQEAIQQAPDAFFKELCEMLAAKDHTAAGSVVDFQVRQYAAQQARLFFNRYSARELLND